MVFMNAFYVLAAQLHVHRTGGTASNILDQPFFYNPTDGLLTREMSERLNEGKPWRTACRFTDVTQF